MRRYRSLGKVMAGIVGGLSRAVLAPLPAWPKAYAMGRFIERSIPIHVKYTPLGPIKFFCPGHNPVDRAFGLFSKEADTIAWLDKMQKGDVLWDIGANVGTYSLYAALKGVTVCAFEPEASNYWILNRNLDLNAMHDRVKALNVALSSKTELARFVVAKPKSGGAKHPGVTQSASANGRSVLAFTGNELFKAFDLPRPSFIKIDVDGHEKDVVRGLDLADAKLRSLQIELRGNGDADEICRLLAAHGFAPEELVAVLNERGGKATNFRFNRRLDATSLTAQETFLDGHVES